jgi:glycosyltransferase involved in cell wall biosynthesis
MKVIRIIARLNTGGPARHVTMLSAGLSGAGYDSLLLHGSLGDGEGSLEHLVTPAFRSERVHGLGRSPRPLADLRALIRLVRILFRERPALVDTHTSKAGTLGRLSAAIYNFCVPRSRRCGVIHTYHGHVFHGYFGRTGSAAVRIVERFLGYLTDVVIALSPLQAHDLGHRYRVVNPAKIRVVPLGIDASMLASEHDRRTVRNELAFAEHDVVLGFVGRLVPIKAPDLLLEAFAAAQKLEARLRLLIVGDGELRQDLEARVLETGLVDRVRFAGWRDDRTAVYAAMDAVVLTSRNEGTPLTLIEAAAAGLPSVSTAVGGVPDVIEHQRHGLLTPPGDVAALTRAFVAIARSADDRTRMGEAARREVVPRYSPHRLVEEMDSIYKECVLARRGEVAPSLNKRTAPGLEG